jgi:hypothetical protein
MNRLEEAKGRLVRAFELDEDPQLASLLRELPEYRDELLDFWVILAASDRQRDLEAEPPTGPLTEAEEDTIRDICLSASLGPEWLELPADESDRSLAEIGFEMRRIREAPYRYGGTANEHFQRAAIYAWLANKWTIASEDTVSRMAVQKLAYLLEQGLGFRLFGKHKKHRLGPYDPTARYRDAEPIAFKNEYLEPAGKHKLRLGPEIEKAVGLADRYLRHASLADSFVTCLRDLRLDEWGLETLATVHAVAATMAPEELSADAVRQALAQDEKWRRKLGRTNFTQAKVKEALHRLSLLRLLETRDPDE